jgi:hypothetical protein
MPLKSRQEQAAHAEEQGRRWLKRMKALEDQGVNSGPSYEEAERKSEFWLIR